MLAPLPITKVDKQTAKKPKFPYSAIADSPSKKTSVLRQTWAKKSDAAPSEEQRLKQLEKMLDEAQSRAAIVEQEAYDKAYAAGEKAGLALGEKRAEQIISSMAKITAAAEKELSQLQHQSIEVVTTLAEHLVKHIVGNDEINLQPIIQQAIEASLSQLDIAGKQRVVLTVHPHDLAMFKRMQSLAKISIKSSEHIQQGSCKLLTPHHDTLIDPQRMIKKASKHIYRQFVHLYEAQHD